MKTSTIIKDIFISVNDQRVMATASITGALVLNYGADIDGNRGIDCWVINDVKHQIPDTDENNEPILPHIRSQLESQLIDYVINEHWDFENTDENNINLLNIK